ncbi:MAG: T9SS type A sorting domain-containing protein [Bacteroidota bacterium]
MKKLLILLITWSILMMGLSLVAQNTFQKTFGGSGIESSGKLIVTSDSNYLWTGYTTSISGDSYDAILSKNESNGNFIWTKTYDKNVYDFSTSLFETSDGGYIIIGNSSDTATSKIMIIKTDENGDTLWTKFYENTFFSYANEIIQTNDNGYLITANLKHTSSYQQSILLLKIDSFGDLLWSKRYYKSWDCGVSGIIQTSDNGFMIIGYVSDPTIQYEALVLKTDSVGNIIWAKRFGSNNHLYEWTNTIIMTTDNNYLISGTNNSEESINLIKITNTGDTIWTRNIIDTIPTLFSYYYSAKIKETPDGYIISGTEACGYNSSSLDSASIYLVKTDFNGIPIWSRKFGNIHNYYGEGLSDINCTKDNGYIINGHSTDAGVNPFGNMEIYLIKTDNFGVSNCNNLPVGFSVIPFTTIIDTTSFTIETIPFNITSGLIIANPNFTDSLLCYTTNVNNISYSQPMISCNPNPFNDHCYIEINNISHAVFSILIYDISGKLIQEKMNISDEKITIEKGNMNKGLYFFQVRNEREILSSGKFIIE